MLDRRRFLTTTAAASLGASLGRPLPTWADATSAATANVPVTKLTEGPRHHWFGYYDKEQFSPDGSLVLANRVSFEGRSPTTDDIIDVGTVPTDGSQTFQQLGTSHAWGWQQGCMLQWIPGRGRTVIWNDIDKAGTNTHFISRVQDLETNTGRTLDRPIYTVSPDGRFAASAEFERIQNMRPGYGYPGVVDPNEDDKAPQDGGIHRVDLETGDSKLIVSYADMAAIPHDGQSLKDKWHYFNHLLIDPSGERMIFLHRWRDKPSRAGGKPVPNAGSFKTRMVTCRCEDGGDRYILDPSGATSHFIWRDPQHICAWTKYQGKAGFYLFRDQTREVLPVGAHVMPRNGHNTYVPGTEGQWILNDTYPVGKERMQTVYLYHVPSNVRYDVASFHSPAAYKGEWRTDLHPRNSRDGKSITVDSPHDGGRQIYHLDISEIIAKGA